MPDVNLAPLSLGELLDQTFSYLRKHFWLFAGIMVAPEAVLVGLNILLQIFLRAPQPPSGARAPSPAAMAAYGMKAGLSTLAIWLCYYVVYAFALGAITQALSDIHLGRTTTIRGAYGAVRRKVGRVIHVTLTVVIRVVGVVALAMILLVFSVGLMASVSLSRLWPAIPASIGLLLGLVILCVVPAVLLVRYSVAVPAVVLENLSARQALKRSVALTKGALWRLFVVGMLMSLIRAIVVLLFQAPFTFVALLATIKGGHPSLWVTIASLLVGGVAGTATTPLLMIGFAVAYYDLRVRKEGFDLQLMMSRLDETRPAGAAAGEGIEEARPLEDAGLFGMCILTLLTAGIYPPLWLLLRRKALNNLSSRETLQVWPAAVALAAMLASLCFPILGRLRWGSVVEAENALPLLHPSFLLLAGVIMMVQCFKVRRILLDHLAPRQEGMFSASTRLQYEELFSRLGTFCFGIFYLQYKINAWLDRFMPGADGDAETPAPEPFNPTAQPVAS
jgi:hypothetical protein